MEIGLNEALLVLGVLLVVLAGLSGLAHGTVLSISVLSVAAGYALESAGVISVAGGEKALIVIIELALIFTLFADGLIVEREMVRSEWRPVARAISVAMPLTLIAIALAAKLLFSELSWPEALLLGAVLAPTDPVITSTVVAARQVPARVRHVLNLESGLNDGLALPFVLFFLAIAAGEGSATKEGLSLVGEAFAGATLGMLLGVVGGLAVDRAPGGGVAPKYEGVYGLGLALIAYGLAELTIGNGLVATFVAALTLAYTEREMPDAFQELNESVSASLQVVTFVLFGAVFAGISFSGIELEVAVLVLFALFIARPAATMVALTRTSLEPVQRRFIAWFGPKGVASMLFALFVLNSGAEHARLIFVIAAAVVLASILAHGLTDTIGARWIERRLADGEGDPG